MSDLLIEKRLAFDEGHHKEEIVFETRYTATR